jgi:hypothetical protein
MERIDTKRGRESLKGRREPYWYKLSRGCYVGLRKLTDRSQGTWMARYRDERGQQRYRALGESSDALTFDAAKTAAESWFKDLDRGVGDRHEDGELATVGSACRAYVRALRTEGRLSTAHDAHMRFRRTVYGAIRRTPNSSPPRDLRRRSPDRRSPQRPRGMRARSVRAAGPNGSLERPSGRTHSPRFRWRRSVACAFGSGMSGSPPIGCPSRARIERSQR